MKREQIRFSRGLTRKIIRCLGAKTQLIDCMSCLHLEVGLLRQFGPTSLFKRVIFTNGNKPMLPRTK